MTPGHLLNYQDFLQPVWTEHCTLQSRKVIGVLSGSQPCLQTWKIMGLLQTVTVLTLSVQLLHIPLNGCCAMISVHMVPQVTLACAEPDEGQGKEPWSLASTYPMEQNNRANTTVTVKYWRAKATHGESKVG